MDDFVKKARRSVTKAAHKAASASAVETTLDEFPAAPELAGSRELSIKVVDVSAVQAAVLSKFRDSQLSPIRFLIRDENDKKRTILEAEVVPGRGFVVRHLDHKKLLVVTPPKHSQDVVAKLEHPAGATLYKIFRSEDPDKWRIERISGKDSSWSHLELTRTPQLHLGPLKAAGVLFDDAVYKLRKSDGERTIAKILPKMNSATNTYLVRLTEAYPDMQLRVLALALGLATTLAVAYDELLSVLKGSMAED